RVWGRRSSANTQNHPMMINGTYFQGERMTRRFKHASAMSAVAVAIAALATIQPVRVQAAEESHYQLVENWAQFPPGVTKWGAATGVDVDSHDNVYVFHRNA